MLLQCTYVQVQCKTSVHKYGRSAIDSKINYLLCLSVQFIQTIEEKSLQSNSVDRFENSYGHLKCVMYHGFQCMFNVHGNRKLNVCFCT